MPARLAAAVVLVREGELFWVRRSREVALGGGFYAFPGGRVDEADELFAKKLGLGDDGALRIAALRETFEETGVLLANGGWSDQARDEARRRLLAGELSFEAALSSLDATLDPGALHPAGRWVTPPFVKVRFDAHFFAAAMPEGQNASVWPGELVDGEWITPKKALDKWGRGDALLHPPALHLVRCLERESFPACVPAMAAEPRSIDFVAQRIEFQAGVLLVPVRTPTLPPATHTNCWIVGEESCVVIDPASPYEEEQAKLEAIIDGLFAEGRQIREILLTHEHHDHVGGVEALRDRLKVPVRAHRLTAERLEGRVRVDAFVEDGEVIELPGRLGLRLRAVHTPGHARGHLCFFEETTRALFTGDMVAGIGTIVVDPPEGDMGDYVASLETLRALPPRVLYPAHGPAIPDGPAKLDEYLAHRLARENLLVEALRDGPGTALELVPRVYTDVPEELHPLAARSLTAILLKLEKEGRAGRAGDVWRVSS